VQGLKPGGFKLWDNWIQQLYSPTKLLMERAVAGSAALMPTL
jgi:hypothetical protein